MTQQGTDKQQKVRWKKGQSGNPNGRPPKERSLITIIEQYLALTPEQVKIEATKNLDLAHQLALKYLLDCNTHPYHTDRLMDRLYGAPQAYVDMTTKGNEIKQSPIYNIVNPDTRILLERLDGGRQTAVHINGDIPQEPQRLLKPTETPVTQ
jgi:hypothetical protein